MTEFGLDYETTLRMEEHNRGVVKQVDFSSDGEVLAVGGDCGKIHFWRFLNDHTAYSLPHGSGM